MDFNQLSQAVINGKADEVIKMTNEALSGGIEAKQVMDSGLIAGMNVVGVRFKRNEIPASRRKTTYSTGTSAGPIKSNFLDFIVFVIR